MTTYVEGFEQADSSTLGPDLTWTEVQSNLTTVSGRLRGTVSSDYAFARAEHDLASADHTVEIDVDTLNTGSGFTNHVEPCVRFDSASLTCYSAPLERGAVTGLAIMKTIAGTRTQLAAPVSVPVFTGTVRLRAYGSTITAEFGAISSQITDTSINSGTRGGVGERYVTAAADVQIGAFRASDTAIVPNQTGIQFYPITSGDSGKTAGTTIVLTVPTGIVVPAGSLLTIRTVADNNGTSTVAGAPAVSTVVISRAGAGTPVKRAERGSGSASGSGITGGVWTLDPLAVNLVAGDTVTVTWAASLTARAAAMGYTVRATASAVTTVSAGSTTGTPSVAITPTASGQAVYAVMMREDAQGSTWTDDSDTTNGSWTPLPIEGTTGGQAATNVSMGAAYKVVTASGAQTFNPTITNSGADWLGFALVFAPVAAPTVTSISPTTAAAAGGDTIVITGTGFTYVTQVTFGPSIAASFTVNSSTQITATTSPFNAGGAQAVVVAAQGGTSNSTVSLTVSAPIVTTQDSCGILVA